MRQRTTQRGRDDLRLAGDLAAADLVSLAETVDRAANVAHIVKAIASKPSGQHSRRPVWAH